MSDAHRNLSLRPRPTFASEWPMLRDALGDHEVMLNANAVANSRDALAARVLGQQGFKIDPVTTRLNPTRGWTEGSSGLKRGYRILASAYGQELDFDLLGSVEWRALPIESRARYVTNVLEFQRGHLLKETRDLLQLFSAEQLGSIEIGLRPSALLAPYAQVTDAATLMDQLALWQVTPPSFQTSPVELVLAVDQKVLEDDDLIARIAAEIVGSTQEVVWSWVPGLRLKSSRAVARRLEGLRNLITVLSERKRVKALHADFLELLLSYDGIDEGCSGPQLGVASEDSGGAGMTIGLFYSPVAHAFLHYKLVARVVDRCSSLRELAVELCPCELCADLFREGKGTFKSLLLTGTALRTKKGLSELVVQATPASAQLNRFHNLLARRLEVEEIQGSTVTEMSKRLTRSALRLLSDHNGVLAWLGSAIARPAA